MALEAWELAAFGLVVCAIVAGLLHACFPSAASRDVQKLVTSEIRNTSALLFDGPLLIGASGAAKRSLKIDDGEFSWTDLHAKLASAFPGFPADIDTVKQDGMIVIEGTSTDLADAVTCEWVDGVTRVEFKQDPNLPAEICQKELDTLRLASSATPYPVWREDAAGQIEWSNAAYQRLCRKLSSSSPPMGFPLFPDVPRPSLPGQRTRVQAKTPNKDQKLWFDVSTVDMDNGKLGYAVDINAVVDAEIAQRNFVQTLAKTFAQLSIGLAIFDRNRQLALFNPALIDLTTLQADFLSSRPTLTSFFDRLRDQRVMPEPKDYASWRQQISDLAQAAADGRYRETWSLPSGSVYSVWGRPHPDGAVAFLFEDISAEVTLTRRFRADLEMNQSIMDHMDQAIVVFAQNGSVCFSNQACQKLWKMDPENSFAQVTVEDMTRLWQSQCKPTPVWGDLREFVAQTEQRASWSAAVSLRNGTPLQCKVQPILNGATMISFDTPTEASVAGSLRAFAG
jgi:PAS domain-containing protein